MKEYLEAYESTIEKTREKYILAGDSERLKEKDKEVEERRDKFIGELKERGIKEERAKATYEAELKKAEYDKAREELGERLSAEGKKEAEIFQKLVAEEKEILNQAKIETWPPKEKGIFKRGLD